MLDFEPLSHDNITKTEALQTSWNEKWELAKHYLILLKLRTKVLEYMAIIQDGQEFCSIQCNSDLESLETALHNYEVLIVYVYSLELSMKCEMLKQRIELWHNYNDLKAAVSTIIEDI